VLPPSFQTQNGPGIGLAGLILGGAAVILGTVVIVLGLAISTWMRGAMH